MSGPGAPTRLRVEYLQNPMPMDTATPRLSWVVNDGRDGAKQSHFQVIAATKMLLLDGEDGDLWDTGKTAGDQSVNVPWAGKAIPPRTTVYWKVRTWDAAGAASPFSDVATFETGLPNRGDWTAKWIGASLYGNNQTSVPAPHVRQTFTVDQPVARARLYVTAMGLYEAQVNGHRVGDDVFTPGWTDYSTRVQYQAYDVTAQLHAGEHAFGVLLGDGWACGHVAWCGRQVYCDRPMLMAQLEVELEDGNRFTLCSDEHWKWTTGPVLESDFLMGESYDARQELGQWTRAGYDDSHWRYVDVFDDPGAAVVASASPRVKRIMEIEPVADPTPGPSRHGQRSWVFDLGQNMVGWARLKVRGKAGQTITLRFAEILDAKGQLYTDNLRRARATDYYTCRGEGEEVWEPRFTFHGFRYVEVSGMTEQPGRDAVTGIVLHSDTPATGTFECNDALINQLQRNIQWGQRGNFLEVPTDCPQRDERLGWTGDAQVFVRTAAFNMDVAGFFAKWQQDIADAQLEGGGVPNVCPNPLGSDHDGGPAWSDAAVICPWTMYQCYGDERLLAEHYPSLQRYVDHLLAISKDGIRSHPDADVWHGYGDWLAQDGSTNNSANTPKDLIGTAFVAHDCRLMSRIAAAIGKDADVAKYEQLFERTRQRFCARFVTGDGLVIGQTQTAYVLALHFDLLPESQRPAAVDALVRDIHKRGMKLSTGFVGSPYLPHVLSRFGHDEVAFALLHQMDWPSWLYAVTQGATTIWERWDGWTHDRGFQSTGMNSFNHYAYGSIGEWLYSRVAGIAPGRAGYKHVHFAPTPGGKLTQARATLQTLYGEVSSAWTLSAGAFTLQVKVPANATATVQLPDGSAATDVAAGSHTFTCKL